MKKSTFWIIVAAIAIVFTIHAVCNIDFIQAMIGVTTCCASLVIGAWYERKEREQEENH